MILLVARLRKRIEYPPEGCSDVQSLLLTHAASSEIAAPMVEAVPPFGRVGDFPSGVVLEYLSSLQRISASTMQKGSSSSQERHDSQSHNAFASMALDQ